MATQGYLSIEVPEACTEPLSKLTSSQKDELVKKCVQALIVLGQERQPIRKSDLGRLVFAQVSNYRVTNGIIHLANEELQDVFGMRLYFIDDKSAPKFLLVNNSLAFERFMAPKTEDEKEEIVLILFALMEIFVSVDFRSMFEDLEKSLKPFEREGKDFLKNYLDKFVKLMYLSTTKHQGDIYYVWGARAYAEFDLDKFFKECFLNLAKEQNPEAWPDLVNRLKVMKKLQQSIKL